MQTRVVEVLREFVEDCEFAHPDDTYAEMYMEWPDLAITYEHAKDALTKFDQEEGHG